MNIHGYQWIWLWLFLAMDMAMAISTQADVTLEPGKVGRWSEL